MAASLYCPNLVLAQKEGTALIDSLVKAIPNEQVDSNKITLLDNISYAYYAENPDEGIKYGLQALQLAQQIEWKKGIAHSYNCLGINYENKGVYPKALDYFFKSLRINEEMNDTLGIAKSKSTIGIIYDDQKDYPKALEYYTAGLTIFRKLDSKPNIAINLGNIALVYQGMNNIPKALEYDTLALKLYEQLNDKSGIARSVGNIGLHFAETGHLDESLEYSIKALKLYQDADNKYGQAIVYGNLGALYYRIAIDSSVKVTRKGQLAMGKNALLQQAVTYLRNCLAIARQAGYLNLVCENENTYARAQEQLGNYKDALTSYQDYAALKDSVFNDENRVKIQNLTEQRLQDLKDKQSELDKLAQAKDRNERLFLIVCIVLLSIVTIVITRNFTTQKKLNNTITKLVSEQEATILQRTADLQQTNKKLLDLIQFNAHNIREPLTRVMGAMMIRDLVTDEEFFAEYWPMMVRSANDLDDTLKKVIDEAQKGEV